MRVELERTGGLAGRTLRWELDTAELSPAEAAELATMLEGADSWAGPPAPGADRFHYRLRVRGGEHPLEVSFGEPGPAAAGPLLVRLTGVGGSAP